MSEAAPTPMTLIRHTRNVASGLALEVLRRCFFVLAVTALAHGPARGQEAAPATPPAVAPSAAHATIVLPPVLVQGETATLAVLDALGRPAANVPVVLGGGTTVTTDATGRAAFVAPDAAGVLRALLQGPAEGSREATAPVIAPGAAAQSLRIDSVERTILLKDPAAILGAGFSGAADENSVTLAGLSAAVLAASPAGLVVLPNPRTPLGDTGLAMRVGGLTASLAPLTVIALELSSSSTKGQPGEKGELRVTARGTDRAVEFELRAQPPGRIELTGVPSGGAARGRTSGGAENFAGLPFTFRAPGDFYFELRLVPEPRGLPDAGAARRELLEAQRLAPPEWAKRVNRVLDLLTAHPQDVREARDALEKMLAEKPEGEFGRHLEAAWRILLNRE